MQTKKPTDPKSIQQLMGESTLGNIIQKAKILDKINHALYELLSPEIRDSTYVMNLNCKENRLILASHNSSIATRLRYQNDTLIRQLNRLNGIPEIHQIECVVRPLDTK